LARLGVEFAACYTSPKVRARDTARLACEALNVEPEEVDVLGDGFGRDDALELLMGHEDESRVLAIGHNPSFEQVVHDLTGARVDFKKGGLVALRVTRTDSRVIAMLRPRDLESIAVEHR
jgi:phosphohistidine phosphatase